MAWVVKSIPVYCTVNAMATDDLVMQGARASAAKIMTFLMVKTSLIPPPPPPLHFPLYCDWLILYLLKWLHCFNLSPPGQNGHHFTNNIFSCIVVHKKFCILIKISLKFVSKGLIDKNPAFGSDIGLSPFRYQAIIWTNADPINWCIYAALGGDELMHLSYQSLALSHRHVYEEMLA